MPAGRSTGRNATRAPGGRRPGADDVEIGDRGALVVRQREPDRVLERQLAAHRPGRDRGGDQSAAQHTRQLRLAEQYREFSRRCDPLHASPQHSGSGREGETARCTRSRRRRRAWRRRSRSAAPPARRRISATIAARAAIVAALPSRAGLERVRHPARPPRGAGAWPRAGSTTSSRAAINAIRPHGAGSWAWIAPSTPITNTLSASGSSHSPAYQRGPAAPAHRPPRDGPVESVSERGEHDERDRAGRVAVGHPEHDGQRDPRHGSAHLRPSILEISRATPAPPCRSAPCVQFLSEICHKPRRGRRATPSRNRACHPAPPGGSGATGDPVRPARDPHRRAHPGA